MRTDCDPLFPQRIFAHAVSLGGDCEPAHTLRLLGRHSVNSLFDWLVTPLDSICAILADDGARLGTTFVAAQDGTSVRCGAYDVLYHHEFQRDGARQVVFDTEAILACRTKMLHKMASFLDVCEGVGTVLFIRLGMGTTLSWDRLGPQGEPPRTSDLNSLSAVLTGRFPDLDFRLLLLSPPGAAPIQLDEPLERRIGIVSVPGCGGADVGAGWALSDADWSEVLARVEFSTTRCGRRPLEERLHWSGEADPPGATQTDDDLNRRQETAVDTYLRQEGLLSDALAGLQSGGDAIQAVNQAKLVLRQANLSPQIRQKASRLLSACGRHGEALAALRRAAIEAPGLPEIALDIAIALEALSRPDEALAWVRRELVADPLRPAICKRLLRLEYGCGEVEAAFETLRFMLRHGLEPPSLAHEYGLRLWRRSRAHQAVRTFAIAYVNGYRDRGFLADYLDLLTGEARYAEVLQCVEELRREDPSAPPWLVQAGRAKLSLDHPREAEIGLASRRSASATWLDTAGLLQAIISTVRDRRAFSFIRVGDGEARFLVATQHERRGRVSAEEAGAIAEVIWDNWFGEALETADPCAIAALAETYTEAVKSADVIGAADELRLRQDTGHYGYLALQEAWLRDVCAARPDARWTSALSPRDLHRASPFLADLLRGQDVVGVISPHAGLAEALQSHLEIARVVSWVIPAEGRLPTAAQTRASGRHFPTIYTHILQELTVPRPGCVFLVAGGLLGKIYCHRIKELGGVALDIGSLADAWMGYNTRPGQFHDIQPLPAPKAQGERATAKPNTTYACLSIGKTSSMALAAALHDAGLPDVAHIHYLGPRATALKRLDPEPMLDLATSIAARLKDPEHRFCMVASVRDPIARAVSQAFHNAAAHLERTGEDIVRDADAFITWYERKFIQELTTDWFDDSYKATFGFDFREHAFDHERRSVRFASPRLRLLVLRVEDGTAAKEAELGWLLQRDRVALPVVNDAASREHAQPYKAFVQSFVAPASWLDRYYETEAIRHFYTEEERAGFRARWSGRTERAA